MNCTVAVSLLNAVGSRVTTTGNRLTSLLEGRVEDIPTKNAINFQADERLTVGDLAFKSRGYAAGLAELDYGKNATLLLILPNESRRIELQLAAAYAGCKVATVDASQEVDIGACLKTTQARGLVVPPRLVPQVRKAVVELTLASKAKDSNPRYFRGNFTAARPIGSLDYPHLKQVFQTGLDREPRFHLLKHLPMYYPIPNPLNVVPPLSETDKFFTVLSNKGEVVSSSSREELFQKAESVASKLALQPDEAVMCAGGDPYTTMVGFLACLSSWSQLVIPDPANPSTWEQFAKVENVVAAIGDQYVPKGASGRVVKL